MKFYHKGVKKTNETSTSQGCLLLIGFGAIVYLVTLLDDIEDLKDYVFELVGLILMGVSVTYAIFSKKGKLSNYHITLENNYFKIEKVSISVDQIIIDLYVSKSTFSRYHLRDVGGKISVYSVFEDDLLKYFQENLPNQVFEYEEESSRYSGSSVSILGKKRTLYYDLNSGKFTINSGKENQISVLPDVYTYDPKYKIGKPLKKK